MLKINQKLYDEIVTYCKINEIEDIDKFCSELLLKAFTVEKYGNVPVLTVKSEPTNVDVRNEVPIIKKPINLEEKDDYYDEI